MLILFRLYVHSSGFSVLLKIQQNISGAKVAGGETEKPMPQKTKGKEEIL